MRRNWGMFLYALLGGFCIGLGGTAFLRIKDSFTGGVVVGALFFAIGLFTICTRGYNLFTGKDASWLLLSVSGLTPQDGGLEVISLNKLFLTQFVSDHSFITKTEM